jgi:GAF domain-containing protein
MQLSRDALAQISSICLADASLNAILDKLAHIARDAVPGADEVSMSLVRNGSGFTAAYTSQLALDIDEMQYLAGHGPCLEAAQAGLVLEVTDMRAEERWPEYAERAAKLSVLSSLSVPLPVQTAVIGALNVYSARPAVFDAGSRAVASELATFVAVACANADAYTSAVEYARQMQEAMDSRAVIEQAKGIVMARQRCTAEAAFEVLRRASMHRNVKLRDLAERIVAQTGSPGGVDI